MNGKKLGDGETHSPTTSNPKPTGMFDELVSWTSYVTDGLPQRPEHVEKVQLAGDPNPMLVLPDEYEVGCHELSQLSEHVEKVPFVGDKEHISVLADEYKGGSPILLEKIKVLSEQYVALRRSRGDGNCFFRSFMLSYLEHILETQDKLEVRRVKENVEQCRKILQDLGYIDFTFEDFFALFLEQLDDALQGSETSMSHAELIERSRDQSVSDYVVMFFRFVTSGEIKRRSEFFEPFIMGLSNSSVDQVLFVFSDFLFDISATFLYPSCQFCKSSVEPMGEESDHVHITALSDALGVPIRVVYLDRSSCDASGITVNHHDFIPATETQRDSNSTPIVPFISLLYRPGHYDILYTK